MKLHESGSKREQPAEDNYFARIVGIYDIGLQSGYIWEGKTVDPAQKIEVTYELVTTDMADGRPFWVSEELSAYTSSKKTAQRYTAAGLREGESPLNLLNKPVMVAVKHDGKGYARVRDVAGVPSGIPIPELRNSVESFDIYDQIPDLDMFNGFSDFKKSKFTKALDFKETELYKALAKEATDDMAF